MARGSMAFFHVLRYRGWVCTVLGLVCASVAPAGQPLRYGVLDSMAYPLLVRDASGQVTGGLLRELGDAIAAELGTKAQHVLLSRRRMEPAVRGGQVDLLCYWSPKWAEQPDTLLWSVESLPQIERIVTRRNKMPPALTLDNLEGKRLATQLGYRYPGLQPWFDSGQVKRVDETRVALMFKTLEVGAADALVTSDDEIEGFFHNQPGLRERFEVSPYVVSKVATQCAVSKQSNYSLAAIDKALHAVIKRGDLARMATAYRLQSR